MCKMLGGIGWSGTPPRYLQLEVADPAPLPCSMIVLVSARYGPNFPPELRAIRGRRIVSCEAGASSRAG